MTIIFETDRKLMMMRIVFGLEWICELVDRNFSTAHTKAPWHGSFPHRTQQPPPRWLGVVISPQPAENYCNLIIKQFKCKISLLPPRLTSSHRAIIPTWVDINIRWLFLPPHSTWINRLPRSREKIHSTHHQKYEKGKSVCRKKW